MKIALQYPPQYDGELHINVDKLPETRNVFRITTEVAALPQETERQVLERVAADVLIRKAQRDGNISLVNALAPMGSKS